MSKNKRSNELGLKIKDLKNGGQRVTRLVKFPLGQNLIHFTCYRSGKPDMRIIVKAATKAGKDLAPKIVIARLKAKKVRYFVFGIPDKSWSNPYKAYLHAVSQTWAS